MIDWLRVFMHRPLADAQRLRLFLAAAVTIVLAAGALALTDEPPSPARDPAPPARTTAALVATPAESLELPSEEGRAPAAGAPRADVEAAKAAARRFLAGYLPYTYGQKPARAIPATTDELRRRLADDPPRVPPGERTRHPRVVLMHADGAGPVRAAMVALVTDGARRYTVQVELEQRSLGWTVTSVGS